MKALIKVGYGCNDNCTFCHVADERHRHAGADEVRARIDRAARLGHTMVVLSGGEPTIRPELLEWAAHAARLGLDLGLVTNGRMLAYPELVDRLLRRRLRYVHMSLHGGSARVHDRIVRAEAFAQTWAALVNLAGRGLDLSLNCVVTSANLEHLVELVDAVLPFRDVTLKFSMVEPKGGGARLEPPRVTEVAARVEAAIAHGLARGGPRFAHDGIPLCLLPGREGLRADLRSDGFVTMVEVGEPDFFPVDEKNRVQPPPCRACALRGPCPGLFTGYAERFGDGELRPRTGGPRSNSFHYVAEAAAPPPAPVAGGCPILADGVTPWDRGRQLFVAEGGGRLARYRTATRDFTDAELEAVKLAAGQVYLDVSTKAAPDDFARDLRQLRRAAGCAACPEDGRCTGIYEPVAEEVFSRDDARVRALVAELEGDVLDVGCGDGRYEELLASRAAAGRIRYRGLDPDAARIEALRRRWPWAELRVGTAEALADEPAIFDHVLCLRSWNHFADPAAAVRRLAAALRPGGTLLVVDNVAFALVRTPAQATRAEASPALAFEHYRNDGAAEALERIAAAASGALELLERRDVGPATSNQWLLRYRRIC